MEKNSIKYWIHPSDTKFVLAQIDDTPLTCIDFWCKAGSYFEKKGEEGMAHFLEHMLFKGSRNLEQGEFDFKIENMGGSSNAATGLDDVHYYVLVPTSKMENSIELILELVLYPRIRSKHFEKEREVIIEEIKQQYDEPDEVIYKNLLAKIWGKHPYGRSILGEENSIKQSSIDKIIDFHQRLYIQNNYIISIAGDLPQDIEKILLNLENIGSSNNKKKYNEVSIFSSFKEGEETLFLDNLNISRVIISWEVSLINYQKLLVGYELLSYIMTEGRRSLLVKELRERKKLVDSVNSEIIGNEKGGILTIEAFCKKKDIRLVEKIILESMYKFSLSDNINSYILRGSKMLINSYLFNIENSLLKASYYGSNLLWGREFPLNNLKDDINYWSNSLNIKNLVKNLLSNKTFKLFVIDSK
tara:strand:+ start:3034 stop:4278 length:1245 start_codon:yes stop_codon:yes gene_type:complete